MAMAFIKLQLKNLTTNNRGREMNTVSAVNKHQARWPKGYVMAVIQDDVEVTYGEFMQCVKEMSEHGAL